jgi:hypothetical protein
MGGAGKTDIAGRFLRVLPGGLPSGPDVPKDRTLRGCELFEHLSATAYNDKNP